MPKVRYKVTLTKEERERLQGMTTRGKHNSQSVLNALVLLGCDEGPYQEGKLSASEIARVLPASERKVDLVKRRFVEPRCCWPSRPARAFRPLRARCR